MAKKKGEQGSNLGLIITLVFFVLSTVILGVTTYMGFSEIDKYEKTAKQKDQEKKVEEESKQWYRFLYLAARAYMGLPSGQPEMQDLPRLKAEFDEGRLQVANSQKDKDEAKKWIETLDAQMAWNAKASNAPSRTFTSVLEDKDRDISRLRADIAKANATLAKALQDAADDKAAQEKELAALKKALDNVRLQAAADRAKDTEVIREREKLIKQDNQMLVAAREERDKALRDLEVAKKDLAREQANLRKTREDLERFRRDLEETERRLQAVVQKTGIDLRALDTTNIALSARDKLERWNKSWQIVDLDRRGNMPYINLGSADKVTPQLTFSIHGLTPDGRLNLTPKGTLEVMRVIGPNLSQARITSVNDKVTEPISKGDRLFHPSWDPLRPKHIAIAGIVDLDGDGTDGTARFLQMLRRQNILVDSYIDTSNDKMPQLVERVKGQPVSIDTEYLVLGYSLKNSRHPMADSPDYNKQFDTYVEKMRSAARENAVKVIRLGEYLEMMGVPPADRDKKGKGRSTGSSYTP